MTCSPAVAMRHGESGVVLLEVIMALVILGCAGLGVAATLRESMDVVMHARELDEEVAAAGRFLDAAAIWTAPDLDRHLGDRPAGSWRLAVSRFGQHVYRVSITDSTGASVLVETYLYRPSP